MNLEAALTMSLKNIRVTAFVTFPKLEYAKRGIIAAIAKTPGAELPVNESSYYKTDDRGIFVNHLAFSDATLAEEFSKNLLEFSSIDHGLGIDSDIELFIIHSDAISISGGYCANCDLEDLLKCDLGSDQTDDKNEKAYWLCKYVTFRWEPGTALVKAHTKEEAAQILSSKTIEVSAHNTPERLLESIVKFDDSLFEDDVLVTFDGEY